MSNKSDSDKTPTPPRSVAGRSAGGTGASGGSMASVDNPGSREDREQMANKDRTDPFFYRRKGSPENPNVSRVVHLKLKDIYMQNPPITQPDDVQDNDWEFPLWSPDTQTTLEELARQVTTPPRKGLLDRIDTQGFIREILTNPQTPKPLRDTVESILKLYDIAMQGKVSAMLGLAAAYNEITESEIRNRILRAKYEELESVYHREDANLQFTEAAAGVYQRRIKALEKQLKDQKQLEKDHEAVVTGIHRYYEDQFEELVELSNQLLPQQPIPPKLVQESGSSIKSINQSGIGTIRRALNYAMSSAETNRDTFEKLDEELTEALEKVDILEHQLSVKETALSRIQDELKEEQVALAEAQKRLKEARAANDSGSDQLLETLKEKDKIVNELQDKLKTKEREAADLIKIKEALKTRELEVENLRQKLKDKEPEAKELAQVRLALEDKVAEVRDLHSRLEAKGVAADELSEVKATLRAREMALKEANQNIEDLEKELDGLEDFAKRQANEIKKLRETIKEKDESYNSLWNSSRDTTARLDDVKSALQAEEAEVRKLQAELAQLKSAAQDKDADIRRLRDQLKSSDSDSSSSKKELKSAKEKLEKELKAKEKEVKKLREKLESKENELSDIKKTLKEARDRALADLKEASKAKDKQAKELAQIKDDLKEKERELMKARDKLKEKSLELGDLIRIRDTLQAKQQECDDLAAHLKDLERDAKLSDAAQRRSRDLHEQLDFSEREIANLKRTLNAREEALATLQATLEAKDLGLADYLRIKEQLEAKEVEAQGLQEVVEDMMAEANKANDALKAAEELQDELEVAVEEISELKKKLEEAENARAVLEAQLNEQIKHATEQAGVTRYNWNKAQELKDELKATQLEVVILTEKLKEKELECADLTMRLAAKEAEIEASAETNKNNVRNLKQLLQQQAEATSAALATSRAHEAEVQKLKKELREQEQLAAITITESREQARELRTKLYNEMMNAKKAARESQAKINKLKEQLQEADDEAAKLKQDLEDKDREVGSLKEQLQTKEQEFNNLKNSLDQSKQEVPKVKSQCREIEDKLKAKEKEVRDLDTKLKAKEQEHRQLQALLDQQKQQGQSDANMIRDLEKQLKAKDEEIAALKSEIESKDQDWEELKALSDAFEEQIRLGDATIRKLEEDVKVKEKAINDTMESLKSQEKTANDLRKQLTKKLKEFGDLTALTSQWSTKSAEAKAELQKAKQEYEALHAELKAKEAEVEATLRKAKDDYEALQKELESTKTANEAELQKAKEECKRLEEALKVSEALAKRQLNQAKAEQEALEANLSSKGAAAEAELRKAKENIEKLEKELSARVDETKAELRQERENLKALQEKLMAQEAEAEDKLRKAKESYEALEKESKLKEDDAKAQLLKAKESYEALEKKLKAKEAQANAELRKAKDDNTTLQNTLKVTEAKLAQIEADLDNMRKQSSADGNQRAEEIAELRKANEELDKQATLYKHKSAILENNLKEKTIEADALAKFKTEADDLRSKLATITYIIGPLQRSVDKVIKKAPENVGEAVKKRMLGILGLVNRLEEALQGVTIKPGTVISPTSPDESTDARALVKPEDKKPEAQGSAKSELEKLRELSSQLESVPIQKPELFDGRYHEILKNVNKLVTFVSKQIREATGWRLKDANTILEELQRLRIWTEAWYSGNLDIDLYDEKILHELGVIVDTAWGLDPRSLEPSRLPPEHWSLRHLGDDLKYLVQGRRVIEILFNKSDSFTPAYMLEPVKVGLAHLRRMEAGCHLQGNALPLIKELIAKLEEHVKSGVRNRNHLSKDLAEFHWLFRGMTLLPKHNIRGDEKLVESVRATMDEAMKARKYMDDMRWQLWRQDYHTKRDNPSDYERRILKALMRDWIMHHGGINASWLTGQDEESRNVRQALIDRIIMATSDPLIEYCRTKLVEAIDKVKEGIDRWEEKVKKLERRVDDVESIGDAYRFLYQRNREPAGMTPHSPGYGKLMQSIRRREARVRAQAAFNLARVRVIANDLTEAIDYLERNKAKEVPRAQRFLIEMLLEMYANRRGEGDHAEAACFCNLLEKMFGLVPGDIEFERAEALRPLDCKCKCHPRRRPRRRGHGHGVLALTRRSWWPAACNFLTTASWLFMLVAVQPSNLVQLLIYVCYALAYLCTYVVAEANVLWQHVNRRYGHLRRRWWAEEQQQEQEQQQQQQDQEGDAATQHELLPIVAPRLVAPTPPPASTVVFTILTFFAAYAFLTYVAVRLERDIWTGANKAWREAYLFDLASHGLTRKGWPYLTWSPVKADFRLLVDPVVLVIQWLAKVVFSPARRLVGGGELWSLPPLQTGWRGGAGAGARRVNSTREWV
ncbi:hypothetical protein VTJ04DRAFT_2566 [Mycothermus thermophilus]|uniref:uncharacterized protein n=1 Tax=Humicola insolens TaxID=85995 RepID=UPI003742B6F0